LSLNGITHILEINFSPLCNSNIASETPVTRELSIANVIDQLKREVSTLTSPRLVELLRLLVIPESEISRYASFREQGYARNIVCRDETFEILMICWKSGHRSLIHDHGNSCGGVKVLQGVLTESQFELAPNGMIKPSSSRDYQPGDIQIENQFTIHQVSNLQPPSLTTISLHIYVPPMARMNIYKLYEPNVISGLSELYNFGGGI
jgi:cysteine dioxygenase